MMDIALKLLQPAINLGLLEQDFWEMTKAEVERYLDGALWRLKTKAQFDYSLADLIGASVARLFSNENKFPSIEQVYPALFEEETEPEEEQDETVITNSINNFLQFAMEHNARVRGVENTNYDD